MSATFLLISFLCGLFHLPVEEARTKRLRHSLKCSGTLIVTKSVIGKADGIRQHPTRPFIHREKAIHAKL